MFNRTNVKVASLFDSLSSKTSGGAGRVNAMVGSALARSGTDFTYILLRDETPRYPHEGKTIALGEPFVFGFGPKKIISLFRTGWKTARLCRKNEIRVLIGHGDFFYMVAVLAKYFGSGAKTVSVVHSTIGVWPGFVRKTLLAFLRKSDLVVFVSDEERLTFRDEYGFENGRLVTIHNGIDTENVRKSSASSAPEIPKLPNRFRFVSLGRLVWQKDFPNLVRALSIVRKRGLDAELVIVGDGEDREKIASLSKESNVSDRVTITGSLDNPFPMLSTADAYVQSSAFEGFGLAIVEAMSLGKAVISTDCPTGPREILSENVGNLPKRITRTTEAEFGTLVPVGNPEALAEAMERIVRDTGFRENLAKKALERSALFEKTVCEKRWVELIGTA